MNVVFRADASVLIGTGHVMRCLTLANALIQSGHNCHFICREHSGHLGDLIRNHGFDLSLLAPSHTTGDCDGQSTPHANWLGASWLEDAEQTKRRLNGMSVDWLVVDHYALDARWESVMAPFVGRILAIDDIADRPHRCEVLLDQNLGRREGDYDGLIPPTAIPVVGPRYALLRPEFVQWREKSLARRRDPEVKRILVSLGGVDRTNITGRVLEALTRTSLPADTELDIVMGAASPALCDVQSQAKALPFKANVVVNISDMAKRMAFSDLSIGAAGSTSWERCCLGLPAVMVVLAENQRRIANALDSAGAAVMVEEDEIASSLCSIVDSFHQSPEKLNAFSKEAAGVCDGEGALRLVSVMTKGSRL